MGRFLSEDPIGLSAGLNQYAFANNDPINGSDPSGMDPNSKLQAACAAASGQYAEFSDGTEVCGIGLGGGTAHLPPVSVTGYQPTSDPSSPFYTPFPGGNSGSGNNGAQNSYPKIGPQPLPSPKSLLRCEVASVNAGLATGIDVTFLAGAKTVVGAAEASLAGLKTLAGALGRTYAQAFFNVNTRSPRTLRNAGAASGSALVSLHSPLYGAATSGSFDWAALAKSFIPVYNSSSALGAMRDACIQ